MTNYLTANAGELWMIAAGFDDLLLTGTTEGPAAFTIKAQADASWGSAQPIDNAVQRWMSDGAVATTQGHDNRTLKFDVVVSADHSADLAAGEAQLALRSGGPVLLKWIPPQGEPDAAATIFEVWTWHMPHTFDLGGELRLSRKYALEMTAKPWARSESATSSPAPALPGAPTTLLVDACTSTTAWSTSTGATLSIISSTAVRATLATVPAHVSVTTTLTRTGSVTGMGTTPYLMIDSTVYAVGGSAGTMTVSVDGQACTKVGQISSVSYWQVPTGVISFTTLNVSCPVYAATSGNPYLQIADVSRTDTIAGLGSRKQLVRSLEVGGSVKTSGSIHVASPSSTALGSVLIYTSPDTGTGYSPSLRQYRTSGNTVTPDATCASGSREALVNAGASAGSIVYSIPAGQLPEGQYVLVARVTFGSAATMTTSFIGGGSLLQARVIRQLSGGVLWPVLGTLALPGSAVPQESTVATILTFSASATTGTHTLDELYLLDVTHGSYSLVLGLTNTHLWLDAPDADPNKNRPAIYVGNAADRSDAKTPPMSSITARGDHDLDPSGAFVFSVTDGIDNAAVSATFFHRWHTHAGD